MTEQLFFFLISICNESTLVGTSNKIVCICKCYLPQINVDKIVYMVRNLVDCSSEIKGIRVSIGELNYVWHTPAVLHKTSRQDAMA